MAQCPALSNALTSVIKDREMRVRRFCTLNTSPYKVSKLFLYTPYRERLKWPKCLLLHYCWPDRIATVPLDIFSYWMLHVTLKPQLLHIIWKAFFIQMFKTYFSQIRRINDTFPPSCKISNSLFANVDRVSGFNVSAELVHMAFWFSIYHLLHRFVANTLTFHFSAVCFVPSRDMVLIHEHDTFCF